MVIGVSLVLAIIAFTPTTYAKHEDFLTTCLSVPSTLCLNSTSHVITLQSVPSNVAAYW